MSQQDVTYEPAERFRDALQAALGRTWSSPRCDHQPGCEHWAELVAERGSARVWVLGIVLVLALLLSACTPVASPLVMDPGRHDNTTVCRTAPQLHCK